MKDVPTESPNSMGLGERYHGPLRRIFLKLNEDASLLDDNLKLNFAYKSMNDTLGPEGYVPTLLVYGMLPRIPLGDRHESTPNQSERMKGLSIARTEMEQIVASLRLKTAAVRNSPVSLLDSEALPGTMVLVYRKYSKIWEGPFELSRISGKTAYIKTDDRAEKPFSVTCVRPFYNAEHECSAEGLNGPVTESEASFFTRVLDPKDVSIEVYWDFKDAINDEMRGLFEREAFTKVPLSTLPANANILRSRFVGTQAF